MEITDEIIEEAIHRAEARADDCSRIANPTFVQRVGAFFTGRDLRQEFLDAQFGVVMACNYVDELMDMQAWQRESGMAAVQQ